MIITRKLTNIRFQYDTDTKMFAVTKIHGPTLETFMTDISKAEAGAFSRFIFSIFQYRSNTKRVKKLRGGEEK